MASTITSRRTVEQFCSEIKSRSLGLQKAVKKDSQGVNQPLLDKDGHQKWAVLDDAGNTVAWTSKAINASLANTGKFDAQRRLAVLNTRDEESGECYVTLSYSGEDATRPVVDINDLF